MHSANSPEAQGSRPYAPAKVGTAPIARLYIEAVALANAHARCAAAAADLPPHLAAMVLPDLRSIMVDVDRIELAVRQLTTMEALVNRTGRALPADPCTAQSPDRKFFCILARGHKGQHEHPTHDRSVWWSMAAVVTREADPVELRALGETPDGDR